MHSKYLVFVFLLSLSSCWINAQAPVEKEVVTDAPTTEVKVFEVDKGWGYDIYVADKKYIHQATIPSVPGTSGFATEEDARKVGDFTASKIERNIMPPSVTPQELDSLGIMLPKNLNSK